MIDLTDNIDEVRAAVIAFVDEVESLPADPALNPCVRTVRFFQETAAQTERPRVSGDGNWYGETWPKHKGRRLKDGTERVPWGGETKRRGRGKTLGRLKTAATGQGKGSRLNASTRQLGERAGGMWSQIISVRPVLSDSNRIATLHISAEYYQWVIKRRKVVTDELLRKTEDHAGVVFDEFVVRVAREKGFL